MNRDRYLTAAACGGVFLLCLALVLPRAAVSLQAGDGAEYALAALRGTLIHPPGFPLYGRIATLLVAAVGANNPYAVMALFSGFCQALAAALVTLACVRLSASRIVAATIALAWICYEPTLRTATDAEVFGLHHVICALIALQAIALLQRRCANVAGCWLLGLLCGLGGAHQPIVVFWAPLAVGATLAVGHRALRSQRASWPPVAAMLLGTTLGLLPYLWLFGQYATDPLLAFGRIEGLGDVVAHATRDIYGTFNIHRGQTAQSHSYIGHFFVHAGTGAPAMISALPGVLWLAWRRRSFCGALLGLTLVSHLAFVAMLRFPPGGYDEVAVRFYPAALLCGALCLAQCCGVWLTQVRWVAVALMVLVVPAVSSLPYNLERADARADLRGAVYMHEALREIPHHAVWLTSTDTSSFGAIYWQNLGLRPDIEVVVTGRLALRWYREGLRSRMPFLVNTTDPALKSPAGVAKAALAAGRAVVAEPMPVPPELVGEPRGVVMQWYLAGHGAGPVATAAHLQAFCARWPQALATLPPARRATIWAWEGGFAAPVLRVMRNAAQRANNRPLAAGAAALMRGEWVLGRENCGASP